MITDTLPDGLQWNSLAMLDASHPFTWFLNNGVLHFIFDDINLPDSLSDEPGSHGQVRFTVLPSQDLLPGATVLNIANIYFDFNEPIITEPSVLGIELSTGAGDIAPLRIGLLPNPALDHIRLADPSYCTAVWSWSILTIDGRTVRSEQGPFPAEGISIAPLRNGTYALQLHLSDRVITERFIKTAHE